MKYFFGLGGGENTCLKRRHMLLSSICILRFPYLDYTCVCVCVCMHMHACMHVYVCA